MDYSENIKWRKARKKLGALKGFYKHLLVYVVVNTGLFILRGEMLYFSHNESLDKNFMEWIDWNILIVPVFWGIGLLFHAAKVFQYKLSFIKSWEERQLAKFRRED